MSTSPARRKLLRGSLAAPLVLTVSSASAQAVTSFTKCLANGAANQPTNFFSVNNSDGWFRIQKTVFEYAQGNTILGFYYQDPVLSWINVANNAALPTNGNPRQTGNTSTRWLLAWFSPTGQQAINLSVQKPGSSFLAASVSCYNSLKA